MQNGFIGLKYVKFSARISGKTERIIFWEPLKIPTVEYNIDRPISFCTQSEVDTLKGASALRLSTKIGDAKTFATINKESTMKNGEQ